MVRRTDELFGLKFGKNKNKVDTALSWDKASKIIEKDLKEFVNSHQEEDLYNRGKPEIRDESEYMTISSMTGATLQFIYSKDGTGVAIVDGPDVKPQKFNCTVSGNRVSKDIGDAYNCFIRVDKEQGKINAKKNQKYRRESLNRRNRSFIKNESHGASTDLIKTCRGFYPLIDQITDMIYNDLPTFDDPTYDEYKHLLKALLDLRKAIISVRDEIDDLK